METCYISAAVGIDISDIKAMLHNKGLHVVHPAEIPSDGLTIIEKVKSLIEDSDLFLAVLDKGAANRNTYIEIGMAVAYEKQILIVADRSFDLPSDVWGLVQVTAGFENREAIDFAVDQVLAAPKAKRLHRTALTVSEGRPLGIEADNLLQTISAAKRRPTHAAVEDVVEALLRGSGIHVVTRSRTPDDGADFAIWSSELSTILGNPILIEVKKSLNVKADVIRTARQVTKYMSTSNSRFALIFYLEGLPPDVAQKESANYQILFLRIPDLIAALKDESFSAHIRKRRNMLAHGGGA